jgi:hypothetical protein
VYYRLVHPFDGAVNMARGQNAGFDMDRIRDSIEVLNKGGHSFAEVDGNRLSNDERQKLIADVMIPFIVASEKGRRVAGVFGSRSDKWQDFGTRVPALIVYDDAQPVDVYPHDTRKGLVTIVDYLASLHR